MPEVSLNERQLANRVKWVRALLSNEYRQGFMSLKVIRNEIVSHCCLGVACEIVNPEAYALVVPNGSAYSHGAILPSSDAEDEFGLSNSDEKAATYWNDTNRYSFERIADFVAYGTEHGLRFGDYSNVVVPVGFATEWLEQFDGEDDTTV